MAGVLGGRPIAVPKSGTRPTSERTREAIFSRLEHLDVLDGAVVLDLYAGSGALGLEAVSRGAVCATLVDSARAAAEVAKRNVVALGLGSVVKVVADDVCRFVARSHDGAPYTLVFMDPPYDLPEPQLGEVLASLAQPGMLADDAVVVVERSTRSAEPTWPTGLTLLTRKDYGETAVYFAEPTGTE